MVANNMKINSELLPVKQGDGICSIESKNSTTDPSITPVPINSGDEEAIGQYCAVAIGNATSALAENAFTCGKITKATASAAVAMGRLSEANGRYSAALNEETQANAQGSLSTGYGTIANGSYSAAFGHTTCANKTASISEGAGTWTGAGEAPDIDWDIDSIAKGSLSHVGGYKSNTIGKASFAHGVGLQTTNTAETALGQYNVSNNGTLFSVGNGSSFEDKSNAFGIRYGKFAGFDVDGSGTKGQHSNGNWKNLEGNKYDLWTIFRTRTHTRCYKTSGYCPFTERTLNLDKVSCKQIVGISFIEPVRHTTTMYLESPNTLNDSDENSWKQFANHSMIVKCKLSSGEVRRLSNYEFGSNVGAKNAYSVELSNGYRAWSVEIPKDAVYIEIYIVEGTTDDRVELSNIYLDDEDKVIVGIGEKSLSEDDIIAKPEALEIFKSLFDRCFVEGVISQTQTWAVDGLTYTMTNIVRGAIPKHFITAFIELTRVQKYAKGTRYEGSFDYATGYFSLNSLTDISYEEALRIYNAGNLSANRYAAGQYYSTSTTDLDIVPRTLIYDLTSSNWTENVGNYFRVANYAQIETMCGAGQSILNYRLIKMAQTAYESLQNLIRLWKIDQFDVSAITSARNMTGAKRLRVCNLFGIAANWSFPDSSLLEAASVAYMINYAKSGEMTITLHADAYARAIADDDVQAALEAHTNVTLASA